MGSCFLATKMSSHHVRTTTLSAALIASILFGSTLFGVGLSRANSIQGIAPTPEDPACYPAQSQGPSGEPGTFGVAPIEGDECEPFPITGINLSHGRYALNWRDSNGNLVHGDLNLSGAPHNRYLIVEFYNPHTRSTMAVRQEIYVQGHRIIGRNPVDSDTGLPVNFYSPDVLEVTVHNIVARDSYGTYPVTLIQ